MTRNYARRLVWEGNSIEKQIMISRSQWIHDRGAGMLGFLTVRCEGSILHVRGNSSCWIHFFPVKSQRTGDSSELVRSLLRIPVAIAIALSNIASWHPRFELAALTDFASWCTVYTNYSLGVRLHFQKVSKFMRKSIKSRRRMSEVRLNWKIG